MSRICIQLTATGKNTQARSYELLKINLLHVACPREISASKSNTNVHEPLVIEANKQKLGKVDSTQYCPAAIVAAGDATRRKFLAGGVNTAWAWVEQGVNIKAAADVSLSEIQDQLNQALKVKYMGKAAANNTDSYMVGGPYIMEIYPYDSYLIFSWSGDRYKIGFKMDPVADDFRLDGEATKVVQEYVTAAGMPNVQTGQRMGVAVLPPLFSVSYGAPNSELVAMQLRDWSNIQNAAKRYVDMATQRGPGVRKLLPAVGLANEQYMSTLSDKSLRGRYNVLIRAGIDPVHFAMWSAEQPAEIKAGGIGSGRHKGPDSLDNMGTKHHIDKANYHSKKATWHLTVHTAQKGKLNNMQKVSPEDKGPSAARKFVSLTSDAIGAHKNAYDAHVKAATSGSKTDSVKANKLSRLAQAASNAVPSLPYRLK